MTVFHVSPEAMTHHVENRLVCKFRPDPDLALKGRKVYKGLPIGKLEPHWPHSALKAVALEEAKTFIGHMAKQGHKALQNPEAMELWGPYKEKPTSSQLVNIEEGNPFYPEGKWAFGAKGAWRPESKGPQPLSKDALLDSPDWRTGVAFLIRGRFESTIGHQEETTGIVIL